MRKFISLVGFLALGSQLSLSHAESIGVNNYQKARAVLDQAVQASGGTTALNAIQSLLIEREGTGYARNQSPAVDGPLAENATATKVYLDLANQVVVNENEGSFVGGFQFHNRLVIQGTEAFNLDLINHAVTKNPPGVQASNFDFHQRLFPPLLLRKALQQSGSLRYLGETTLDKRAQDIISFAWDNGGVYNLYLDAGTHLLTQYELLFPDAYSGDAVSQLQFFGYENQDGLMVPAGFLQVLAGTLITKVHHTRVEVNPEAPAAWLALPEGYEEFPPVAQAGPKVTQLGGNLHLVENLGGVGGYAALFAEFDDHLVAFEAPLNPGASANAIGLIQAAVPDKPIRYVVLSHHHDDHSGGLGAFVAAGATIVTTAKNEAYFRKLLQAQYSLAPWSALPEGAEIRFEFVEGSRTFGEGESAVEVYDIGPTPHANELLVAWHPAQGVLYEADHFSVPAGGPLGAGTISSVHLDKVIQEKGWKVKQLVGVHGVPGTIDDLHKALKLREESEKKPATAETAGPEAKKEG